MFLTPAEVAALTGRKQPAAQRRWLTRNGYRFDVRADGSNAVLAEAVRQRHRVEAASGGHERPSGPDVEALRRVL